MTSATKQALRESVLAALGAIAPEADLAALDPSEDLREALDLDSMDILRLATALHERHGVDIPEADYRHIVTLDGCVAYLVARC